MTKYKNAYTEVYEIIKQLHRRKFYGQPRSPDWNYGGKSRFDRNDEPYFA